MKRRRLAQLAALTGAWVLSVYAASTAPLVDLWRPLVALVLASLVVGALLAWLALRRPWIDRIGGILWLFAIGAVLYAAVLTVVETWRAWVLSRQRCRGERPRTDTRDRIVEAMAMAAALVAVGSVLSSDAVYSVAHASAVRAATGPSIYLVLLDGYPADTTLRDVFGFDNHEFYERLETLGFSVRRDSRSNYNATLTTPTSMFQMAYLDDVAALQDPPASPHDQVRLLSRTLNESPALDYLESYGYDTETIASWYGEAVVSRATTVSRPAAISLFEEQLARLSPALSSLIAVWPDSLLGVYRAAVRDTLAELVRRAETPASHPTFTFVHVFAPHPPFGFGGDIGKRATPDCYPRQCALTTAAADGLGLSFGDYAERFNANLEHVNSLVVDAIRRVVDADPAAVVVLFSDHGARPEAAPSSEHFRTLLATRTPGHRRLISQIDSNIDVLPAVFRSYLGLDVPFHIYSAWWSDPDTPLVFTKMTEP